MLLKQLDSSSIGRYVVVTESWSVYEIVITENSKTLRRVPSDVKLSLREDEKKINIIENFFIELGAPAKFILEPLGLFGNCTIRTTTRVEKIEHIH